MIRDHPRSRGVYATPSRSSTGPSGIIPARAGFTLTPATAASSPRDHPRSRGVYSRSAGRGSARSGSSPLARGLPAPWAAAVRVARDHPRSRGVYHGVRQAVTVDAGSSPLARGLQDGWRGAGPRPGIIPARAGFTSSAAPMMSPARDHPRSRGVYCRAGRVDGVGLGIIPARAGFTGGPHDRARGRRDHPRSRGVYPGFYADENVIADHPRSRGVYVINLSCAIVTGGSSPLARGLRRRSLLLLGGPGIIPARAGFTGMRA